VNPGFAGGDLTCTDNCGVRSGHLVLVKQIQTEKALVTGCSGDGGKMRDYLTMTEDWPGELAKEPPVALSICTYPVDGNGEIKSAAAGLAGKPGSDVAVRVAELWSSVVLAAKPKCDGPGGSWIAVVEPPDSTAEYEPDRPVSTMRAMFEIGGCGRVLDDRFRFVGHARVNLIEQVADLAEPLGT